MEKRCSCRLLYDRDSSVGIATRYGLDGPVIESKWGRGFLHLCKMPLGLPSLLYNGYRVFPGVKRLVCDGEPPPPSIAKVKEKVELYLYSLFDSS